MTLSREESAYFWVVMVPSAVLLVAAILLSVFWSGCAAGDTERQTLDASVDATYREADTDIGTAIPDAGTEEVAPPYPERGCPPWCPAGGPIGHHQQ